jgi:hypothetical protein
MASTQDRTSGKRSSHNPDYAKKTRARMSSLSSSTFAVADLGTSAISMKRGRDPRGVVVDGRQDLPPVAGFINFAEEPRSSELNVAILDAIPVFETFYRQFFGGPSVAGDLHLDLKPRVLRYDEKFALHIIAGA